MFFRRLVILVACALAGPLAAQSFDTAARAAFVYDVTTQTELLVKNADEALPPRRCPS